MTTSIQPPSRSSEFADLRPIGVRTPLREYLAEIWDRREFATYLPFNNLRAQNRDTVLGNVWHLANPAFQVAVYYVIFGVILQTTRGVDNFLAFLTIGVFTFGYTQKTVMEASTAIVRNEGLIRSIHFPRAVLPISTVIGQAIAYVPSLIVMVITLFVVGEWPSVAWLLLVPAFLLQTVFNLGAALVVARATDHLRDVKEILPHIFRLLFYFSGVMFSVDAFVERPLFRVLFDLNPLYVMIELARRALLGDPIATSTVVSGIVWTGSILVGGFVYFRAAEHRYGHS